MTNEKSAAHILLMKRRAERIDNLVGTKSKHWKASKHRGGTLIRLEKAYFTISKQFPSTRRALNAWKFKFIDDSGKWETWFCEEPWKNPYK